MRATLLRLLAPITIKSAARLAANPYKPRRTDGALDPRNLGGDLRFVSQPLETLQPEPLSFLLALAAEPGAGSLFRTST